MFGAPVWVGRVAAPMRTYLARHGRAAHAAAAFCVSGRGGAWPQFFDEVGQFVRYPLASSLALAQRDVQSADVKLLLSPMLRNLRTIVSDKLSAPAAEPSERA